MASIYDMIKGGEKKPKKEIREIRTRKSHDGKLIHTHIHHRPEHHPDEEHVSADMADMHDHMEDHAGEPNAGEPTPDASAAAPAPLTAAPSPMPPPAPANGAAPMPMPGA